MNPQLGQAAFRIGIYITLMSLVLLLLERRGSPEFGVSVITLVVGVVFISTVALFVRFF